MKKDMRRINKIWNFENPKKEKFTFAAVGAGKKQIIVTLSSGEYIPDHIQSILLGALYSEYKSKIVRELLSNV